MIPAISMTSAEHASLLEQHLEVTYRIDLQLLSKVIHDLKEYCSIAHIRGNESMISTLVIEKTRQNQP